MYDVYSQASYAIGKALNDRVTEVYCRVLVYVMVCGTRCWFRFMSSGTSFKFENWVVIYVGMLSDSINISLRMYRFSNL